MMRDPQHDVVDHALATITGMSEVGLDKVRGVIRMLHAPQIFPK
jgi:hypothetical protein